MKRNKDYIVEYRDISPPPPPPKKNGTSVSSFSLTLPRTCFNISVKNWYSNRILKNSTQLCSLLRRYARLNTGHFLGVGAGGGGGGGDVTRYSTVISLNYTYAATSTCQAPSVCCAI